MDKNKKENVHEGHRETIRERFRKSGLEGFADYQVLEFMLFYAIPRRDTNPVAHRLINRFGTLAGVLEAPVSELASVEGVGEKTALFLKLFFEAGRRYYDEHSKIPAKVPTYDELGSRFIIKFAGLDCEAFHAVFLDNSMKVCGEFGTKGADVNSVAFSMRALADKAIASKAAFAVVAHSHPNGLPIASGEDLSTTSRIRLFFAEMNIDLLDHFIVAGKKYSSITKEHFDDVYGSYAGK